MSTLKDPQDLLYTNEFISSEILNESEIKKDTKFYDKYIENLENNQEEETNKYLENDLNETDYININNSLNRPWPVNDSKNEKPLTNTFIKDISEQKYVSYVNKKIFIDSKNRNKNLYPNSTSFQISLTQKISNIKRIYFRDVQLPNLSLAVNIFNNNFTWQFFSNYYQFNNISFNIVPIPSIGGSIGKLSYHELPFSSTKIPKDILEENPIFNPSGFLTTSVNLTIGNYDTDELAQSLKDTSAMATHGGFDFNIFPNEDRKHSYETTNGIILNTGNFYEEPYMSNPFMRFTANLWTFDILPPLDVFYAVNRIEEVNLLCIQTFSQPNSTLDDNYFKNNDIFYEYSDAKNKILNTELIYILVPFQEYYTDYWFDNSNNPMYGNNSYKNPFIPSAFPLVITGLIQEENTNEQNKFKSLIGGVSKYFLSFTAFFDINIYTKKLKLNEENGDLRGVNYYKYIDTIKININGIDQYFFRLGLNFNTQLARGKPFNNSIALSNPYNIRPSSNATLFFNESLYNFFKEKFLGISYDEYNNPRVGRAILTRFIYDLVGGKYTNFVENIDYIKKTSVLSKLGMPIANQTAAFFVSNYNNGFAFIHSNKNYFVLNKNNPFNLSTLIPESYSTYSSVSLETLLANNKYVLKGESYCYLRIFFEGLPLNKSTQDEIKIGNDKYNLQINQNYTKNKDFTTLGIGRSTQCSLDFGDDTTSKSYNNITLRVNIPQVPTESINIPNDSLSNVFECYDIVDDLSVISVELLDSNFQAIRSSIDFNFTMNIITEVNKLKQTDINTRTNQISLLDPLV